MRRSKSFGFAAICVAIVLMVGAAVLPVSAATQRLGPFQMNVRGDNCGPAGYVAFREVVNGECRSAAHRRLLATTGVGLLVLALGMALFAGGDDRRRSMVQVATPGIRRRSAPRSQGSRRYKPG